MIKKELDDLIKQINKIIKADKGGLRMRNCLYNDLVERADNLAWVLIN